jgi:hypothetical protein
MSILAGALIVALAANAGAQDTAHAVLKTPKKKSASATVKKPVKKRVAADSVVKPTVPEPVWPVAGLPDPLPGSLLPAKRIVTFYGNPHSKRMGILGQLPPDQMLAKLDREVAAWNAADSSTPVQPALHLIAVVAQGDSGKDGKYRLRADSTLIEKVYGWAQQKGAILFLDVQG